MENWSFLLFFLAVLVFTFVAVFGLLGFYAVLVVALFLAVQFALLVVDTFLGKLVSELPLPLSRARVQERLFQGMFWSFLL